MFHRPGGVFITVPSTTKKTTKTTKTTLKSTTRKTTSTTTSIKPAPTKPAAGVITPGTACKPEGYWNCIKTGTAFQRCASGTWSVAMAVAPGTRCVPGQSMEFTIEYA
ncbi:hypothetical protein LB505_012555 [Fusarium chuoi]|nr:hypothetical protein LB505_012555 [Fusarium chuoi]